MRQPLLFVFLLFMTALSFCSAVNNANAQSAPSLEELLNPKIEEKPLVTLNDYANDFYARCLSEESLAFDDQEKKQLCGCASARIPKYMSIEKMKQLYVRNISSRDERSHYITYVYTPCFIDTAQHRNMNLCHANPSLKDVSKSVRSEVCQCYVDTSAKFFSQSAASVITNSMIKKPYSLNPAEDFLIQSGYEHGIKQQLNNCSYQARYKVDNVR